MAKRNVLTQWGGALKVLVFPSKRAPTHKAAGILGSPNQLVQQDPRFRQIVTNDGPQNDLFARRNKRDTVVITEHKQFNWIQRAPAVPVAPKDGRVIDYRLGISLNQYPPDYALETFPYGGYASPPTQISVPGYVLYNDQAIDVTPGYPAGALKAPGVKTGGGHCDN